MFHHILTVCTGNICRSPLAEAMLRTHLDARPGAPAIEVRSAGIGALVGEPADATVQAVAADDAALAAALAPHKAQQMSLELARWADLILVMEPHHLHYVVHQDPTARGKTFLLGHWLGASAVGDPYRRDEAVYRDAHARIGRAVDSWLDKLR